MAAVIVRVDTKQIRRLLDRLANRLRNPRPMMEAVAESIFLVTRRAFERQASPEGTRWQPLSLLYAIRKQKIFGQRNILQRRGILLGTLMRGTTADGKVAFVSSGPPARAYARIHQLGGRAGRGRRSLIPARPFLPSPATAEKLALQVIEESFAQAIGGTR